MLEKLRLRMSELVTRDPGKLAQQLFLWIAVPTSLCLCFLIGPFQAADESAHYLRASAIADGEILPVDSPPNAVKLAAGAYEDTNAARLALGQVGIGGASGHYSLSEVRQVSQLHATGKQVFAEHSNTAIYPPPLYIVSATAMAFAKAVDLPVLWWLYFGRIANAVLAVFIIQAALRRSGDASLLLFVGATLPISLFQISTISTDALLFALAIALVVMLKRIILNEVRSGGENVVLAATTFVISIGKIAYLPFVALPIVASWLTKKRFSNQVLFFIAAAILIVIVWLTWAWIVRDKIYSIRPNIEIDAKAQLWWILGHPWSSVLLFAKSMVQSIPKLAIGSVGRWLGWGDLIMPPWLTYFLPFWLVISAIPSANSNRVARCWTLAVLGISAICYLSTFFLIYLQYNEVGAASIVGVQGRYFTLLAILSLAFMPRLQFSRQRMAKIWSVAATVALISSVTTLISAQQRYWTSEPTSQLESRSGAG
jgi:uncharacterized membrane protein